MSVFIVNGIFDAQVSERLFSLFILIGGNTVGHGLMFSQATEIWVAGMQAYCLFEDQTYLSRSFF